ncbi:MAG TPA: sigma-70 family RNA polymerase sigma factor [Streptosporangiaceae bacterium]|nr:sigma-70 family RNA polymerase sigma factor [Streptosporangiaceae bacterium]
MGIPRGRPGPAAGPFSTIAHDPDALEAFYRQHVALVTRFVARRVADPHMVADLTAQVFLAVIGSAHSYRPSRGPQSAWLYGIARNVIAEESRRSASERRAVGRIAGRRLLDEDDIARLEERIDAESLGRAAYQALARLKEDERAVLELVAIDGLLVKEAAAALGIRPGTARARLQRARRAAQQSLGGLPVNDPRSAEVETTR